jgi:hypothetical protein
MYEGFLVGVASLGSSSLRYVSSIVAFVPDDKLLMPLHFSGPGSKSFLDDLASLDPDLYQGFIPETVY